MASGKIVTDKNKISICLKSGHCASEELENLSAFYCLLVGTSLLANDSTCYVLVFKKDIWVLPDSTYGMSDLKKWIKPVAEKDMCKVARIDHVPFSWRARRFLFGLEAKFAIKRKEDFSDIENRMSIVEKSPLYSVI